MAKINQIQNALKELDGGAFQKLADSYLLKKGYPQIISLGSVAGSNKVRKGTPDTLIPTDDGKYVFAEYTTTSKKVFSKFRDDIAKCLNEEKTGVPITKIREIVLCCTSELLVKNREKLQEQCKNSKVNLNIFSLNAISYDLLEKYPSIAKDYLGVEVDTGQIVLLDKFVSLYESNKLTTTLRTNFHFRADEKDNLLSLIQDKSLIIISGKAGVGKSRIAIECYQQYTKENNKYKAYCIFNKETGLFDDIKSYFSDSGDFLILVDDANRISGFKYIVQLLQTKRSDQNFKIIVTVRDYALDEVKKICQSVDYGEIPIDPFSGEEIKNFLQVEFKINNHLYLDRIVDIAQGNPRLAVMAAQVAKDSNTLKSIRDVSELYDQYYSSIKSDLDALEDKGILKVAGIIAFFRSVDRTNNNLMSNIQRILGITTEDFWKASKTLHNMEVLDMFENEVVKISDQILSTYLFYLVFFKEKLIDFSILINDNDLFPQYKQRLIDAINPILNTFNFDEIKIIMKSPVNDAWNKMQEKSESDFLQLIDVFWFLKPTETLTYINDKISSIESQDIIFNDIKFEANSNRSLPKFLSTLSLFLEKDQLNMSLELFLEYAKKRLLNTPKILHCFIDGYGFRPDSYSCGYHVQHAVINKLLEYGRSGSNEYFTRLFIAVAKNYLHTHFSSTKPGRTPTIIIVKFNLLASQSLFELRHNMLKYLFDLYENEKYQKYILKLLLSYTQSDSNISVSGIIENDSSAILSFLNNSLDAHNLYHCIVVQQYLSLLKRFDIPVDNDLKMQFQSPNYVLYDLLTNKLERVGLKLSQDAYKKYKKKKIAKLTSSYSEENYDMLFHQILEILKTIEDHYKRQINQHILSILEELASRNPDILYEVVRHYLEQGDYLEIDPSFVVSKLLSSMDIARVFSILSTPEYPSKNKWLFSYYQHLPINDIQPKDISALYDLYKKSEYKYFINDINDIDYLLKYESIQKGFIVDIVQIIIKRTSISPEFTRLLSLMFFSHAKINKTLNSVFSGKFNLLEDAYIIAIDLDNRHVDYDGKTLSTILDNDHTFIGRYLEDQFTKKEHLIRHDDSRDYSFIWLRNDYVDIMQRVTSIVFEKDRNNQCLGCYELFYNKDVDPKTDSSISNKQDSYLLKEIEFKSDKNDYMRFLFSAIAGFQLQRKLIFYKAFLGKNKEFDDFKNLPFEPTASSLSGSAVPMWQGKIDFYKEITQILCDSITLLKHREFIEQEITCMRNQIQREEKKDFTEE